MNKDDNRSTSRQESSDPPPPALIRVSSGRHPFELTFVGGLACGITMAVFDSLPRSLVTAMPASVERGWELGLILAGAAGLTGVAWPGQLSTGLGLELGAVLLLSANTAMYTIALFAIGDTTALTAGSFVGAVSVGSGWRCFQIVGDLRRLARLGRAGLAAGRGTP